MRDDRIEHNGSVTEENTASAVNRGAPGASSRDGGESELLIFCLVLEFPARVVLYLGHENH